MHALKPKRDHSGEIAPIERFTLKLPYL